MNNVSKRAQAQYTHTKARQTDRQTSNKNSQQDRHEDRRVDRQTDNKADIDSWPMIVRNSDRTDGRREALRLRTDRNILTECRLDMRHRLREGQTDRQTEYSHFFQKHQKQDVDRFHIIIIRNTTFTEEGKFARCMMRYLAEQNLSG